MTQEILTPAFEAREQECGFSSGRVHTSSESAPAHFSATLGSIYLTARAALRSPRQAGPSQPSITVIVEDSADGTAWATIANFPFTASGEQSQAIAAPRQYLRMSWVIDDGKIWEVGVDVVPIASAAAGGGGSQPPTPFVQASDPGVVGEGALWVDTSIDPPCLKIRNAADDGWTVSWLPPQWEVDPLTGGLCITLTGPAGDHDYTYGIKVINSDGNVVFAQDSSGELEIKPRDDGALTNFGSPAALIRILANGKGGNLLFGNASAPADADMGISRVFTFWLDDTHGATKLMVKALDAIGTAVTAEIPLT